MWIGDLAINLLDTKSSMDVALVKLTPDGMSLAQSTYFPVSLTKILSWSNALDSVDCVIYLASQGGFSETIRCRQVPKGNSFVMDHQGTPREEDYKIKDVLFTENWITEPGDSGTILCSYPNKSTTIGLCIGEYWGWTLFEPLSRVLKELRKSIKDIRLWGIAS